MAECVEIKRMSYGSCAIASLANGKTVFVKGGAPGDRVLVEITSDKGFYAEAEVVDIVEQSPNRIEALSPIDELTGLAPWQHLSYQAQLKAKRDNVVASLIHLAHIPADHAEKLVEPCLPSRREWNWRNKMELSCFQDEKGRIELGFHAPGSDRFVACNETKLVHSAIESVPKALRGVLRFVQRSTQSGIYRIGVRHSLATNDLEIALWTPPSSFPRSLFAKAIRDTLNPSSLVRVLAQPGKERKIKGIETLDGRGYWREKLGDMSFSVQAPSFFQANTAQATKLIQTLLDVLGDVSNKRITELYAGCGTFSIPLARAGADVVAVEIEESSIRNLHHNAQANQVSLKAIKGDAGALAHEFSQNKSKVDILLVDPPRAGLTKQALESIIALKPAQLAYISCNPSTLARDIDLFAHEGMRTERLIPIDMFPQTYHVETVVLLSREKVDGYVDIDLDIEKFDKV